METAVIHTVMEPDRDQPPVANYTPVSPLGWDACDLVAHLWTLAIVLQANTIPHLEGICLQCTHIDNIHIIIQEI